MTTPFSDSCQPPSQNTALTLEFSQAASRYRWFLNSMSGSLRSLFSLCDWWALGTDEEMELVIYCTSSNVRSQLIHRLLEIVLQLEKLFGPCPIRILGGQYSFETTTQQVIYYYNCWKRGEFDEV